MIDEIARNIAISRWALPECLHLPIAAVDEHAISTYVGDIVQVLSRGSPPKALLLSAKPPPPPDERLPIWSFEGSKVFYRQMQVWVHVTYTRYRRAYQRAFPTENIDDKILSHAMNRRAAALQGFRYVRITPISRNANSSSAFSEGWEVAEAPTNTRGTFIQYADLCALMLMLDMKLGGGVMDAVNEGQKLVRPRPDQAPLL